MAKKQNQPSIEQQQDDIDAELISILEEDIDESGESEDDELEDEPEDDIEDEPEDDIEEDESPEDYEREQVSAPKPITQVKDPDLVPYEQSSPKKPPQPELLSSDTDDAGPEDDIGIRALLSQFGSSLDNIIKNHKADRDQVEEAIRLIEKKVKDSIDSGAKINSTYLDVYARLLQTKTDINAMAPKALDSVAKLISAGKGNDLIVNLGVSSNSGIDLEKLLQQKAYEDEQDD